MLLMLPSGSVLALLSSLCSSQVFPDGFQPVAAHQLDLSAGRGGHHRQVLMQSAFGRSGCLARLLSFTQALKSCCVRLKFIFELSVFLLLLLLSFMNSSGFVTIVFLTVHLLPLMAT